MGVEEGSGIARVLKNERAHKKTSALAKSCAARFLLLLWSDIELDVSWTIRKGCSVLRHSRSYCVVTTRETTLPLREITPR